MEETVIGKKKLNPEKAGYKDGKGYYIPTKQIWAAMREWSGQVQLGNKKERLSRFFRSCIRIENDKIYLGKQKADFIYNDPCFKKSAKGGEMVFNPRPAFNSWEGEIKIIVLEDSIPKEKIDECVKGAGLYKGIGSRAGEYGRFVIR